MTLKEKAFNFLGKTVFRKDYKRLQAEQAQVEKLEKLVAEAKKKKAR
jgi:phosphoglucomutase